MKTVMVFWTNRSEFGILQPVINRLEKDPDIECVATSLHGVEWQLEDLYKDAYGWIKDHTPDLVVAPFDRVQMLMVAIAAMVQGVPVCQIHAGDLSGPGTWDDKTRYAITSIADLIFCNGKESWARAIRTRSRIFYKNIEGEFSEDFIQQYGNVVTTNDVHVFDVGSTALDDVEPDYSLLPNLGNVPFTDGFPKNIRFLPVTGDQKGAAYSPFDLVLYNPETTGDDKVNLDEIFHLLNRDPRTVVWVGPNGDPGSKEIEERAIRYARNHLDEKHKVVYYPSVPRPHFIGLMERASRIIGNSSAFCLEAPTIRRNPPDNILKDIELIGKRNEPGRARLVERGGSDKIVQHIRRWLRVEG